MEKPVVLWVDDDPLHLAARLWLEDAGMTVITATSLPAAESAILNEPRLDLALLDVAIRIGGVGVFPPEALIVETKGGSESGLLLARLILSERPALPFVGVSALRQAHIERWFLDHSAGFLSKSEIQDPKHFVSFVQERLRPSILSSPANKEGRMAAKQVPNARAEELQVKLRQLELEYELAREGMTKGRQTTVLAMVAAVITTILAFAAAMWGKREFMSGTHLVVMTAVIAFALLGFSSLVFGRAFKLKSQITRTKKELEVVLGESVR